MIVVYSSLREGPVSLATDVAHRSTHTTSSHLFLKNKLHQITVIFKSFQTDRTKQTVQTQIRLPLEEQSDQGLHCLLFHLHFFCRFGLFS